MINIPFISSIFNHESRTVEKGVLVVAVVSMAGALLGLVKNGILAAQFGAGAELDAYFAAFRIPDLIHSVLVFGALTAGFMSVFNRYLLDSKEHGWELASSVMNALMIILGLFAVIVVILARPLIALVAPGFDPANADLAASLLRIMMIQPILLAASNVITVSLQSFSRFFVSSMAPLFYNLGIIIGALWLVDIWGMPGLAWGVVLGAGLHLLVQAPSIYVLGFRWSLGIRKAWSGVREIFTLTIPRMANLAIVQFNFFVITVIASVLPIGTITIYNFSANLAGFPQIIFGLSFATVAFPVLSRLWAEKRVDEYRAMVSRTLSEMWFWVIIVALVALALREPMVRLTLMFGAFDEYAYFRTLDALAIFLLALPGQAGVVFLIRAFFAMGNTKAPLFAALVGSVATIGIAFWFGQEFGAMGLALGPAVASFLQVGILLYALRQSIGKIGSKEMLEAVRNGLFLGLISSGASWASWGFSGQFLIGQEFLTVLVRFLIAIGTALIVFGAGFLLFRAMGVSVIGRNRAVEKLSSN